MSGSAPLVEVAAAPLPAGASAEWVAGAGGARLRAMLVPASAPVRGSVVVNPGRTEALEKYFEVAARLSALGFVVLVHDWRGQGLSHRMLPDRLLGHANGPDEFIADFTALIDHYIDRLPSPRLLLAHSMGGCLTLLALAHGESRFAAAMLSAPMLGVQTAGVPVPIARLLAGGLTLLGLGGAPTPGQASPFYPFEGNIVTHDAARYARNEAQLRACEDLALGRPTWAWLNFALRSTAWLAHAPQVPRVTIPVVVAAAGEEKLVDNLAARRVTARLPGGRFVEIPGALHEILQETDERQAPFWVEFEALANRVAPRPTA